MRKLFDWKQASVCVLLLLLLGGRGFSQVISPGHAGKIESGAGATPYLNQPFEAFVQGNFAYIVGNQSSLEIADITNPAAPVHKGSVSLIGLPNCIFVKGNYVYVGIYGGPTQGIVEIIDVTNPASPVHIGSIQDGAGGAKLSNPISIYVVGNYAYVASSASNALEILDVSNPAAPTHKSSMVDGGGSAPFLSGAAGVFVSGNYAYVTAYSGNALEIVDITNPAAPVHKSSLANGVGGAIINQPNSVFVSGNYAYIVNDGIGALEIVDVTNPAAPVHKGSLADGGGSAPPYISDFFVGAWSLYISGHYAYIASLDYDELEIVDVSNPAHPVHASHLSGGNGSAPYLSSPASVFVSGNYAYVASLGSNALEIVDITTPTAPAHKGSLRSGVNGALLSGPVGVFVKDNYAYVASSANNAMQIVDISNPNKPIQKGSIANGNGGAPYLSNPVSVYVSDNFAYVVSSGGNTLEIINITDPSAPVHVGNLLDGLGSAPYLKGAGSIFVKGNYAYIASQQSNALEIVNISNPAAPVHAGSMRNGIGGAVIGGPRSVFVSGNFAYLACPGSNSIEIVNVSNPAAPVHSASIADGGGGPPYLQYPKTIQVVGNYAYVSSEISNALEIIDVTNPAAPVHAGNLLDGGGSAPFLTGASSVFIQDNIAYVTSIGSQALEVIDVSHPATPVHLGSIVDRQGGATINNPLCVVVLGTYAYVTSLNGNAMEVIFMYNPVITNFSPKTGQEGTQVTITGQNLNTLLTASFNGTPANVSATITLTSTTITVPHGATIGKISVAENGAPVTSTQNFLVTPVASIPSIAGQNNFTATWTDVGAATYYLDVSKDNFSSFLTGYNNLSVGNVTSANVTSLQPGTNYQYRVRSSDGTLSSGNSAFINIITIPATPIANSASAVNQAGFVASWSVVTGASNYYLDVATDAAFSSFLFGGRNLSISSTSQTISGLDAYKTYYYRVRSKDTTGISPFSNAVTVRTLDNIAPGIQSASSPNPTTVTQGNTPTLNAVITDNVNVASSKMFFRGISKSKFDSVALQGPGGVGGNYAVTLQTKWYDSLGLEYYFGARDEAGNKTVTASSFIQLIIPSISLPSLPSGPDQASYRIISFPYQLSTDNKITTVYSNVAWNDNTKSGLWWWDPVQNNGSGSYDQYGKNATLQTVDPGKGYWVVTNTPSTPQLTNVPAPQYSRAKLFSMTLKPGWNEIGNPYPASISWDDVTAYNLKVNPSASFGKLNVYDGTGFKVATGGILLKAFEGGFVKNTGSSDVTIQIPFLGETNVGGRVASSDADLSQDAWNVFLHINQNGLTNQLGGFGMHPQAISGADRYDNFNPPKLLEMPEVSFTNSESPGINFSDDVVSSQRNYIWQFSPGGSLGQPVTLHWNSDINLSSNNQLLLLDEQYLEVVDMTTVDTYSFVMTANSHFRIFFGSDVKDKITTLEIEAGTPYPNPLTAESRASINIALPDGGSDYPVNYQLFNAQGVLIQSTNKALPPGIHQLDFALDKGLSSGIYIYKLSIASTKEQKVYAGKIVKP